MSGSRQLFSQAPIQQAAPMIPVQPGGSALAAAMSQPHPMALQTPSMGIPLSTMMQIAQAMPGNQPPATGTLPSQPINSQTAPSSDASNPMTYGQTSPFGTNPGSPMPQQAAAPGTPSGAAPGMPSPGSPGIFGQAGNWLQGMLGGGGQYPPVAGTG